MQLRGGVQGSEGLEVSVGDSSGVIKVNDQGRVDW